MRKQLPTLMSLLISIGLVLQGCSFGATTKPPMSPVAPTVLPRATAVSQNPRSQALETKIIQTTAAPITNEKLPADRRVVSHDPPTLPDPPKPANINGSPEKKVGFFVEELASGDPTRRLAGWMGLYNALGVPVIGQDGFPLGTTGDDPIGPRYWQVWYTSGLDLPGRGLPLTDASRLITVGLLEADGAALGTVLLDDLRQALQSQDLQVRLMGLFIRERVLRGSSHIDISDAAATPETVVIDVPTLQLLAWLMMRSALFVASRQAAEPGTLALVNFHAQPLMKSPEQALTELNCSDLPGADSDLAAWQIWTTNNLATGFQFPGMEKAFPGFLEFLLNKVLGHASGPKEIVGVTMTTVSWISSVVAAVSFLMQLQSLEIRHSQDPEILERTHHTTYPGNDGTIYLQLYSDPGNLPDGNKLEICLQSFALNALGISISFPAKGFVAGAEVSIDGGMGVPYLVMFNTLGTNRLKATTDNDNGQVEFKVFGAPQKHEIPDSSPPVFKNYSIIVSSQVQENGLNNMIDLFFGGLTFGTVPSGPGGISAILNMLKTLSWDMGEYLFVVIDWTEAWMPDNSSSTGATYAGVVCSLEEPFKLTETNPYGTTEYQFMPTNADGGGLHSNVNNVFGTYQGDGRYTATRLGNGDILLSGYVDVAEPATGRPAQEGPGVTLKPLDTDECDKK